MSKINFQEIFDVNPSAHPEYHKFDHLHAYTLKLKVKRKWQKEYEDSKNLTRLAADVIPEINKSLNVGGAMILKLVHAKKVFFSSEMIYLLFVFKSHVNVDAKMLEKSLKEYLEEMKRFGDHLEADASKVRVDAISNEIAKHLETFGIGMCTTCSEYSTTFVVIFLNF